MLVNWDCMLWNFDVYTYRYIRGAIMPLRLDIKRRLTARFDLCFLSNWRICLKSSLHHSTSPIVQVRPSEVLRPSSYWTVDARVSLQWQRSHLELREPAARQVVWGGRPFLTCNLQVCDLHSLISRFAIFQSERRFLYQGRIGSSLVLMICRLILFLLLCSD